MAIVYQQLNYKNNQSAHLNKARLINGQVTLGRSTSVRVALLEDDQEQATLVKTWLNNADCEVVSHPNGQSFLASVLSEPFDLLIIDWELPDTSGPEVLAQIRAKLDWAIPVIFATQRDAEQDIVTALERGADDYMIKPIKQSELIARTRALARRAGVLKENNQVISFGNILLDKQASVAKVEGEAVKLTQKEFELVLYFAENQGRLISRDHLLDRIWGKGQDLQTRTVDMHVSRVRKKLNISPAMGYRIKTIYQHGYRLESLSEGHES